MRCSQCATESFSRHMASVRSVEAGPRSEAFPAVAACADACPIHLCVQGYAAHIANGDYAQALELIVDRLPLPDTVCRVCDRPCESACVRDSIDGAVAVNDLKRFVLNWAAETNAVVFAESGEELHGTHVAVIGAGPAGLTAAFDLRRRGYEVTLFDAAERPGGMLRSGIPEYRLPNSIVDRDVDRILGTGVTFKGGARLGDTIHVHELLDEEFAAVFLALGAGVGMGRLNAKRPRDDRRTLVPA